MRLLAIDPGPQESALLVYDIETRRPIEWVKLPNLPDAMLWLEFRMGLIEAPRRMAIEMIASYGMPVGAEVFETCVWIGRLLERWCLHGPLHREPSELVYRREVKLHICGDSRAKDSNMRQALIDRYGGSRKAAIGLKASPGPLYGMSGDCWSALGVAITAAERSAGE